MRSLRRVWLIAGVVLASAMPSPRTHAQTSVIEALASRQPDARIRSLPDTEPVRRAFSRSGRSRVNMLLLVAFDARGRVREAAIVEGWVNPAVDDVVREWALGIVVEAKEAGTGRLPLVFRFDDMEPDALSSEPLPPVPESILGLARAAGLERLSANLILYYRDSKVWEASLSAGSGDAATDAAILAWVRDVPALRTDGVVSVQLAEQLAPVTTLPKEKSR